MVHTHIHNAGINQRVGEGATAQSHRWDHSSTGHTNSTWYSIHILSRSHQKGSNQLAIPSKPPPMLIGGSGPKMEDSMLHTYTMHVYMTRGAG